MNWLEISYHATEENYEWVSQIFMDAGSKGVLLEDSKTPHEVPEDRFGEIYRLNADDYPKHGVIVKGYLAMTPQVDATLTQVKAKLLELPAAASSFLVNTLAEEDWAESWKQHYQPINVTEKLRILPSWLEKSKNPNVVEILLDPGMAFGSGTHETTRLCLQLLEKYISVDSRVIDIGCGSGILAIASAKLGAQSVYGADLDEMAIIRAKENAVLNGCDFLLETNHLMTGVASLAWQPNLIIANILAPIIISMLPEVWTILEIGDLFICSGIIAEEEALVTEALVKEGFKIVEILLEKGWIAIVASKNALDEKNIN